MSKNIELIAKIKPVNGLDFPIIDAKDIAGGYMCLDSLAERNELNQEKLIEGMLCYVSEDQKLYQYKDSKWGELKLSNTSNNTTIVTGSGGVVVIDSEDDLESIQAETGTFVFINDTKTLKIFNGEDWQGFDKYVMQDTAPTDKTVIWIDTSKTSKLEEKDVLADLYNIIGILQAKINSLEYKVNRQLDFGLFKDEEAAIQATDYTDTDSEGIEPTDDTKAGSLCMKRGTYAELIAKKQYFLHGELLYCYDIGALFTKSPLTDELVLLGTGSGELPDVPDLPNTPTDEEMDGILTDIINNKTKIVGIEMSDISTQEGYKIEVKDGALRVYNANLDKNELDGNAQKSGNNGLYSTLYWPKANGVSTSPKLYINSIYSGDANGEYDYCPVSHNFIELSNLNDFDLNLNGLYLHYTNTNNGYWITLPLYGIIKAQSTFLIRGAQCSVLDVNTTVIKVEEPDMHWTKSATINPNNLDTDNFSIWDDNGLLRMNYDCSLLLTGSEVDEDWSDFNCVSPFDSSQVIKWYVDLVGIGKGSNGNTMPCESAAVSTYGKDYILDRYYNMDPVSQATKDISARSNKTASGFWTYVNISNPNPKVNPQHYAPKASASNKNIFFNKDLLQEGAPNIVTCSFGYDAHKTRCFTWVSVGYYDEYLEYWPKDEPDKVTRVESFKEGDGRSSTNNRNNAIYNRIRSITTDGTAFTTHKLIIDLPEEDEGYKVYEYRVGREGAWTNTKSFTMRSRSYVNTNGVRFLQFSDQQGFNAEEYEQVRICNEYIQKDRDNEPFDFIINVGDITQNGNRVNEWVNYFKGSEALLDSTEQMFSIGNNDLCPVNVFKLGNGSDASKTNPINATYFFTFEHPNAIPTSATGEYVPCTFDFVYGNTYFLSINSEITSTARVELFGDIEGSTNVYDNLKNWCEDALVYAKTNHPTHEWRVAFCHEAPFTIITPQLCADYYWNGEYRDKSTQRNGSHLNTVGKYFFSKFLQENGFKLCICGHKHTYSHSRYIHDDLDDTMCPYVYDESEDPSWLSSISSDKRPLCKISTDTNKGWVKYVMTQACGFKMTSNKELPAQQIPWLYAYYPVSTETVTAGTASQKVNSAQQYPNYIVWNIGEGNETEKPSTFQDTTRARILGKSYKIEPKSNPKANWAYSYAVPLTADDITKVGGNGAGPGTGHGSYPDPSDYIIVEYSL